MSLLNRPSDGLYSILAVIWKLLLDRRRVDEQQFLNLCAPPTAVDDQTMVRNTLNTWVQLGLLQRKNGEISLSEENEVSVKRNGNDRSCLPCFLRRLVLDPQNNERLVEEDSTESRSADFTRAVCWMLVQDVYTLPTDAYSDVDAYDRRQWTSSLRAFQNDTRWSGYQDWSTILGFGWFAPKLNGVPGLVTDPTPAVRDVLSEVFGYERVLHQKDFLPRLAESLPVIDGGIYRLSVEKQLNPRHWRHPEEHELSPSLSLALLRLETAGHLRLEIRSDADKRTLLGRAFRTLHSFSHVVFREVA